MSESDMRWTDPETGRQWDFTFEWALWRGRQECVGIRVEMVPVAYREPRVLTATLLRTLPWGAVIHEGRLEALSGLKTAAGDYRKRGELDKAERSERFARGLERPKLRRDGRPKWWTDEHYQDVANIYADALALGKPPTKAVHDAFPMAAYTTAARWVRVCRDRGLLAPAPGRGEVAGRPESKEES